MAKVRLTAAQALVRFLIAQRTLVDGQSVPLFHGMFAIFGHGNVAGLGEALQHVREELPTFRAHNEQAMAHAAIAFAKASRRRRMMACTTSIGPGATNMVTAAALAHVNRLPVLLLPGDVFASRRPDPVLQQVENFGDPTITANDCFRPVSRFWDRIVRPEQLLTSLPQAISVLTDPADCGPATIALPQDVQAEAFDYPEEFFAPKVHELLRPGADSARIAAAAALIRNARKPLIIAGGGVHYSEAFAALAEFAAQTSHSGSRDAGRQRRSALGSSLQRRRHRGHGLERGQRTRSRIRPGNRHRHSPPGFHYCVEHTVSQSRAPAAEHQRVSPRCRQAECARRPG